jgi:hypothetical protein
LDAEIPAAGFSWRLILLCAGIASRVAVLLLAQKQLTG